MYTDQEKSNNSKNEKRLSVKIMLIYMLLIILFVTLIVLS